MASMWLAALFWWSSLSGLGSCATLNAVIYQLLSEKHFKQTFYYDISIGVKTIALLDFPHVYHMWKRRMQAWHKFRENCQIKNVYKLDVHQSFLVLSSYITCAL